MPCGTVVLVKKVGTALSVIQQRDSKTSILLNTRTHTHTHTHTFIYIYTYMYITHHVAPSSSSRKSEMLSPLSNDTLAFTRNHVAISCSEGRVKSLVLMV